MSPRISKGFLAFRSLICSREKDLSDKTAASPDRFQQRRFWL